MQSEPSIDDFDDILAGLESPGATPPPSPGRDFDGDNMDLEQPPDSQEQQEARNPEEEAEARRQEMLMRANEAFDLSSTEAHAVNRVINYASRPNARAMDSLGHAREVASFFFKANPGSRSWDMAACLPGLDSPQASMLLSLFLTCSLCEDTTSDSALLKALKRSRREGMLKNVWPASASGGSDAIFHDILGLPEDASNADKREALKEMISTQLVPLVLLTTPVCSINDGAFKGMLVTIVNPNPYITISDLMQCAADERLLQGIPSSRELRSQVLEPWARGLPWGSELVTQANNAVNVSRIALSAWDVGSANTLGRVLGSLEASIGTAITPPDFKEMPHLCFQAIRIQRPENLFTTMTIKKLITGLEQPFVEKIAEALEGRALCDVLREAISSLAAKVAASILTERLISERCNDDLKQGTLFELAHSLALQWRTVQVVYYKRAFDLGNNERFDLCGETNDLITENLGQGSTWVTMSPVDDDSMVFTGRAGENGGIVFANNIKAVDKVVPFCFRAENLLTGDSINSHAEMMDFIEAQSNFVLVECERAKVFQPARPRPSKKKQDRRNGNNDNGDDESLMAMAFRRMVQEEDDSQSLMLPPEKGVPENIREFFDANRVFELSKESMFEEEAFVRYEDLSIFAHMFLFIFNVLCSLGKISDGKQIPLMEMMLLARAAGHYLLDLGYNMMIGGEAGKGKSYMLKNVMEVLPPGTARFEDSITTGALTNPNPQAMLLLACDEAGDELNQERTDFVKTMKRLMTSGLLNRSRLVKNEATGQYELEVINVLRQVRYIFVSNIADQGNKPLHDRFQKRYEGDAVDQLMEMPDHDTLSDDRWLMAHAGPKNTLRYLGAGSYKINLCRAAGAVPFEVNTSVMDIVISNINSYYKTIYGETPIRPRVKRRLMEMAQALTIDYATWCASMTPLGKENRVDAEGNMKSLKGKFVRDASYWMYVTLEIAIMTITLNKELFVNKLLDSVRKGLRVLLNVSLDAPILTDGRDFIHETGSDNLAAHIPNYNYLKMPCVRYRDLSREIIKALKTQKDVGEVPDEKILAKYMEEVLKHKKVVTPDFCIKTVQQEDGSIIRVAEPRIEEGLKEMNVMIHKTRHMYDAQGRNVSETTAYINVGFLLQDVEQRFSAAISSIFFSAEKPATVLTGLPAPCTFFDPYTKKTINRSTTLLPSIMDVVPSPEESQHFARASEAERMSMHASLLASVRTDGYYDSSYDGSIKVSLDEHARMQHFTQNLRMTPEEARNYRGHLGMTPHDLKNFYAENIRRLQPDTPFGRSYADTYESKITLMHDNILREQNRKRTSAQAFQNSRGGIGRDMVRRIGRRRTNQGPSNPQSSSSSSSSFVAPASSASSF